MTQSRPLRRITGAMTIAACT